MGLAAVLTDTNILGPTVVDVVGLDVCRPAMNPHAAADAGLLEVRPSLLSSVPPPALA